jgi:hypothetical protein
MSKVEAMIAGALTWAPRPKIIPLVLTKNNCPLEESVPKIAEGLPLTSLPKKAELAPGWLIAVVSLAAILKPPLKLAIVLLEVVVMVVVLPVETETAFPVTTVIPEGFALALSVRPKNKKLAAKNILFVGVWKDISNFAKSNLFSGFVKIIFYLLF